MQLIDFNGYRQNERMYGGTAGRKMGITYGGKDYLLKFIGYYLKRRNAFLFL